MTCCENSAPTYSVPYMMLFVASGCLLNSCFNTEDMMYICCGQLFLLSLYTNRTPQTDKTQTTKPNNQPLNEH